MHFDRRFEAPSTSFPSIFPQDMQTGQFPTGQVNVSLSYDPFAMGPSRIKVQIVKARNLSCKARDDKEDKCGVSCSGERLVTKCDNNNKIARRNLL